jgi:hypothetical protein
MLRNSQYWHFIDGGESNFERTIVVVPNLFSQRDRDPLASKRRWDERYLTLLFLCRQLQIWVPALVVADTYLALKKQKQSHPYHQQLSHPYIIQQLRHMISKSIFSLLFVSISAANALDCTGNDFLLQVKYNTTGDVVFPSDKRV